MIFVNIGDKYEEEFKETDLSHIYNTIIFGDEYDIFYALYPGK
jgi:hypothetical protein